MSISSIASRTAVYVPIGRARQGPQAIPLPTKTPAAVKALAASPPNAAASVFADPSSDAATGATNGAGGAQESTGPAQHGYGDEPFHEPGIQGGQNIFGDITGDGDLNGDDVMALLKAFHSSVSEADLNTDGVVDTADLGMLISAIKDFNSKTTPGNSPGDGPSRDLHPLSAIDIPTDPARASDAKAATFDPTDPLNQTIDQDKPVAQPGVYGDLTGDGIVNGDDLAMLQQSFGSTDMVGDLNGDGRVDTADLGSMIGLLNRLQGA